MRAFKFDYATERIDDGGHGLERSLLQIYADRRISDMEANDLLRKVADHKWFVSEKLSRDVGFHVAAIDYVENFYRPAAEVTRTKQLHAYFHKIAGFAGSALIAFLTARGKTLEM